jgi:hypothetical protein
MIAISGSSDAKNGMMICDFVLSPRQDSSPEKGVDWSKKVRWLRVKVEREAVVGIAQSHPTVLAIVIRGWCEEEI